MAIQVIWDNDAKTIVRHVYSRHWDLEDFHHAVDENAALIGSVSHRVDIIADLTQSTTLPKGMLSAIGHLLRKAPPNQGLSIIVGANRYTELILKAALKITVGRLDVRLVNSIAEAHDLLMIERDR